MEAITLYSQNCATLVSIWEPLQDPGEAIEPGFIRFRLAFRLVRNIALMVVVPGSFPPSSIKVAKRADDQAVLKNEVASA